MEKTTLRQGGDRVARVRCALGQWGIEVPEVTGSQIM